MKGQGGGYMSRVGWVSVTGHSYHKVTITNPQQFRFLQFALKWTVSILWSLRRLIVLGQLLSLSGLILLIVLGQYWLSM